jgi:5-formyltetrahydrofolate cyclo-ligase
MVDGQSRVLEPEVKDWLSVDDVDLVLVPGLAFDSSGGRVGHGRGYYDKTLAQTRTGTPFKVALAFEFQIFDRVPIDPSDVRMDVLVTEKRVIKATSAASAV